MKQWKTCTNCKQTKSADRQSFHYDNATADGYRCWCIVCVKNYMRNYIPSNEKPRLTADEIADIEANLTVKTLPYRLAAAAIKAKYASVGFEVDGVKYKIKVCAKCEVQKPATTNFFNRRKQLKDGWTTWCKDCNKKFKAGK